METWKPVVGWEGVYSVSNVGRIRFEQPRAGRYRRRKGDMATPSVGVDGYLFISLARPGDREGRVTKQVHRIVCEAFRGPAPPGRTQVNHKNGCVTDCAEWNLEWATPLENTHHAIANLRQGFDGSGAQLSRVQVLDLRIRASKGESFASLAVRFGVSETTASSIARGLTWKHVGGPRVGTRSRT